jgi:tetratricopeptide (TPR) repeat protein
MADILTERERGLASLRAGQYAVAARHLRAALAGDPGHLGTVRALTAALLAADQPAAAHKVLSDYLIDHPACARGWTLAALFEWKLGRYDDAIRVLRRALEFLPQSPNLRSQLDLFLGARGESASGANAQAAGARDPDYLDRVVQDPRILEGLLNLPADDKDAPMLREIESRLARLVEAQPLHADRQLLLARLYLRLGDLAAATRCVHRALRANPDFADARRLRATLLARAGDYDQAIRSVQELIAQGRDWPDLHVQAAQWQHARGRNEQARQHLYNALRINPRYRRAHALLQRCAA